MRIFTAEFRGIYLGGTAVVMAYDRVDAKTKLKRHLREFEPEITKHKIDAIKVVDLTELDTEDEGGVVLNNGDY